MTETASVTESTPTASEPASTASIASTVMENLEADASDAAADAGDTGDTPVTAGDTTTGGPTTTTERPETPQNDQPKLTDAEQLLRDAGVTEPRRPDGRENRIPYSKVVKIIENGLKSGKGPAGQQFAAAQQENTSLRSTVERLTPLVKVLDDGPEAFLSFAAQHDPRYKAFLEARQAPPPAAPVQDEMPGPDLPLPDGSRTYSVEGLKKLLAWNTQQTEQRVEDKLKPFAERDKALREREQSTQVEQRLRAQVHATLEDARTWDGFAEHEPAIVAALQADSDAARAAGRRPTLTLEGAYRQVVLPALKATEAKLREKVIAELKAAPAGTAVSKSGPDAVSPKAGTKSTADYAREVMEKLNRN